MMLRMTTTLEQRAHQDAITLPIDSVVRDLRDRLGATLVAYIADVAETRAVRQWATGERRPGRVVTTRLRLTHQVSSIVKEGHSDLVVQSWMQGLNPDLDDVAPARVLRAGDVDESGVRLLAAARHFARA